MGGNRVYRFSSLYVALKFQFTHSSYQLTYNLDFFLILFVVCFLFIYLFRIQRKPFVQREGVHRALCPEPMMVMNYAKTEFKLPNMIPIWFCNIRLQTKKKQKNEIKKKCDTEGSHLETGITLQYH